MHKVNNGFNAGSATPEYLIPDCLIRQLHSDVLCDSDTADIVDLTEEDDDVFNWEKH